MNKDKRFKHLHNTIVETKLVQKKNIYNSMKHYITHFIAGIKLIFFNMQLKLINRVIISHYNNNEYTFAVENLYIIIFSLLIFETIILANY